MDEQVWSRLVGFLGEVSKPKALKRKRARTLISPSNQEKDENQMNLPWLPLVPIPPPRLEPTKLSMIYYTPDGRARKMALPPNGLIPD